MRAIAFFIHFVLLAFISFVGCDHDPDAGVPNDELVYHEPLDEWAAPLVAQETAWSFRFPTEGYRGGSFNGRDFLKPASHLGEDSYHPARTPVFAIANGVVRQVRRGNSDGYGSVVVIEHRLPSGEVLQSIYGHLSNRAGFRIPVNIGQLVSKGENIGYIGDEAENGDGTEHLHLGLRRGPYTGVYCGYVGPNCQGHQYYDPTDFITPRMKSMVVNSGLTPSPANPSPNSNFTVSLGLRNDFAYGGQFQFRLRVLRADGSTVQTTPGSYLWLDPGTTGSRSFTLRISSAGTYKLIADMRAPGTETWWPLAATSPGVNPRNITVAATVAPSPPTYLRASDATYNSKIRVSWTAASGASRYDVYRATAFNGGYSFIGQSTGTYFDDTSAASQRTYYYKARAWNAAGFSPFSNVDGGRRAN